ncbi:hypothetical protein KIL84_003475 [Mauremys mutica]|uniref:Uncharacterized protein n=1 Tax=Mauremys mutica TaxID=74926 RepID=A0A9D3WTT7_9SAUR|nr:hypothetical protein KIL84_003475 [Mauremys mutica]
MDGNWVYKLRLFFLKSQILCCCNSIEFSGDTLTEIWPHNSMKKKQSNEKRLHRYLPKNAIHFNGQTLENKHFLFILIPQIFATTHNSVKLVRGKDTQHPQEELSASQDQVLHLNYTFNFAGQTEARIGHRICCRIHPLIDLFSRPRVFIFKKKNCSQLVCLQRKP